MRKILVCSFMLMALLFGNMASAATKMLLEDDFNDGVLETSKWKLGVTQPNLAAGVGDTVEEANGILKISQNSTDWGGYVYSIPLDINSSGKIIIKRRAKVHYANNYYYGRISIHNGSDNSFFGGIYYMNYYYQTTAVGFGFRIGEQFDLLEPVWDEWFEEELTFDPKTGEMTYSLNNRNPVSYTYKVFTDSSISIHMDSYGWYTGHYIEMDYITIEQEQTDPCPECNTVSLTIDNWTQGQCAKIEESPEGLILYPSYLNATTEIMSDTLYDFRNTESFVKWKPHAGNAYSVFQIGIQSPYVIVAGSFSTNHSWRDSIVISEDIWYYTRYVVNGDGTYTAITSTGDYDVNGGSIIHTNSDTMTSNEAEFIDSANFLFDIYDNYSASAFLTIGEVKTTAKPVSISGSSSTNYNFEDETSVPSEFTQSGTWTIDTTKGYNSSSSIHSDSSEMADISLDVTNAVSVSFKIQIDGNAYNETPAMYFGINDVPLIALNKSFDVENCWTELTFPIPNQDKSTLIWSIYRAGKIWIDDIKITYDEVPPCIEDDTGDIDIPSYSVTPGGPGTASVRIQNAPNNVEAMGFDITVPDGLTYTGFEKGSLVPSGYLLDVNVISANTLRCGAYKVSGTDVIAAGASGEIVKITFDVSNTFISPQKISLSELKDDIAAWFGTPGCDGGCNGDTNKDGQITPADALNAFQKYMLMCPTSSGLDCDSFCADVNQDGQDSPADALCIFRKYLGQPGCLD